MCGTRYNALEGGILVVTHSSSSASESRPLRVQQGIFVLRYVSSAAGLGAPEVQVSVPPTSPVEIIAVGTLEQAVLGMPGDAIVMKAPRDGAVVLTIVPQKPNGSRDAHVTLERVSFTNRVSAGGHAAPTQVGDKDTDLEILAHVARRGDIVTRGAEWICGPQFPLAIEGVELRRTNPAAGVEIMTSGVVQLPRRRVLEAQPSGTFVGTRGKSTPLVGLGFSLTGPAADRYELHCEALFLGAAIQEKQGRTLDLSGPSGREPLVGLKLSLVRTAHGRAAAPRPLRSPDVQTSYASPAAQPEAPQAPVVKAPMAPVAKTQIAESPGRVKVFRPSRARQVNGARS